MKKILLAIDPLEADLKPSHEALKDLGFWLENLDAEIEAVYVLSDLRADLRVDQSFLLATQALRSAIKKFHFKTPIESQVLLNHSTSRRKAVRELLDHAEDTGAELLVVTSHGRSGMSRLFLGSFAEALLADSPIPVLFLGTHPQKQAQLNKMIFVTDFSRPSWLAFQSFLDQVSPLDPEVVLFHSMPAFPSPFHYGIIGMGAYFVPEADLERQQRLWERENKKWLAYAKTRGIRIKAIQLEDPKGILHGINETARKEKAALIGISTCVEGKIAEELFRSQKFGVWIYGPTALEKTNPRKIKKFDTQLSRQPR